jgi:hypothetical protein
MPIAFQQFYATGKPPGAAAIKADFPVLLQRSLPQIKSRVFHEIQKRGRKKLTLEWVMWRKFPSFIRTLCESLGKVNTGKCGSCSQSFVLAVQYICVQHLLFASIKAICAKITIRWRIRTEIQNLF